MIVPGIVRTEWAFDTHAELAAALGIDASRIEVSRTSGLGARFRIDGGEWAHVRDGERFSRVGETTRPHAGHDRCVCSDGLAAFRDVSECCNAR